MHEIVSLIKKRKKELKSLEESLKLLQNFCKHKWKVSNSGYFHTDFECTECGKKDHDMGL